MGPSKAVIHPLAISRERSQNQSTDSLAALHDQQENLANDLELWARMEDMLMNASSIDEVKNVISQIHSFMLVVRRTLILFLFTRVLYFPTFCDTIEMDLKSEQYSIDIRNILYSYMHIIN